MSFVLAVDGVIQSYPYSVQQLKADNPTVSYPRNMDDEALATHDVYPVELLEAPAIDAETEVLEKNAAPLFNGVGWQIGWTVSSKYVEYTDENGTVVTVQDQIDAAAAEKIASQRASTSISMRQCRLQLLSENKLTDVEAAIAALPASDQAAAQIEWEYAANVDRISPLVAVMASALSLNDEQVDTMFASAVLL
jgi:hypothetical protein